MIDCDGHPFLRQRCLKARNARCMDVTAVTRRWNWRGEGGGGDEGQGRSERLDPGRYIWFQGGR